MDNPPSTLQYPFRLAQGRKGTVVADACGRFVCYATGVLATDETLTEKQAVKRYPSHKGSMAIAQAWANDTFSQQFQEIPEVEF